MRATRTTALSLGAQVAAQLARQLITLNSFGLESIDLRQHALLRL